MADSGSVNGIPATASHYLLTTLLRDRLGFKGVVISDFGDVPALASTYHIAPGLAGAAALAVNAGVDHHGRRAGVDPACVGRQEDVLQVPDRQLGLDPVAPVDRLRVAGEVLHRGRDLRRVEASALEPLDVCGAEGGRELRLLGPGL